MINKEANVHCIFLFYKVTFFLSFNNAINGSLGLQLAKKKLNKKHVKPVSLFWKLSQVRQLFPILVATNSNRRHQKQL